MGTRGSRNRLGTAPKRRVGRNRVGGRRGRLAAARPRPTATCRRSRRRARAPPTPPSRPRYATLAFFFFNISKIKCVHAIKCNYIGTRLEIRTNRRMVETFLRASTVQLLQFHRALRKTLSVAKCAFFFKYRPIIFYKLIKTPKQPKLITFIIFMSSKI